MAAISRRRDDIFKCIFLNESIWISFGISLNFVPKSPINNIPALVQIMAWRRPGDKPLSEPIMVRLPTHRFICVTRPQWVSQHCWWCPFIHPHLWMNTLRPKQMAAISQTTFPNAFPWMRRYEFISKLHWSWFPMFQLDLMTIQNYSGGMI